MTALINASTSSGVVVTSDTSGSLAFQSNGTTITTISSTGTSSLGVTNASNASAGQIGEFVSSSVLGVTCGTSSSSTSNLTSITLTAGDWDISSVVVNYGAGNAVFGNFIALTNNANTSAGTRGVNLIWGTGNTSFGIGSCAIPRYRVSISSTTTYYLQTYGSGSSDTYDGYITARRIR